MHELYNDLSFRTSKLVTSCYSTSFSRAVSFLDHDIRDAIYSIYGFVRLADEIVDTFHQYDKQRLLDKFEMDYYEAVEKGISLNPVLNSFMITVKKYNIHDELIQAFLKSMKTDLFKSDHNSKEETNEYIYGSAEVVGLMCLKVFVKGNEELYRELQIPAKNLGSAFQKVNFLRDIKNDTESLNRRYFHNLVETCFDESVKKAIIDDIENDFAGSIPGIKSLPENSRLGVLIAYLYYKKLLNKIKKTPAEKLLTTRVRVSDFEKTLLLLKAYLIDKLKSFNNKVQGSEPYVQDEPFVILVDENDNQTGIARKLEAHRRALLHRAVSVFIINYKGEWILQRRAFDKYHSHGLWTNTCCTHPHPGESDITAAKRRLKEEMGIECDLVKLFSFTYKEKLDNELTEHELDHVFLGVSDDIPAINASEVEEWEAVPFDKLNEDIINNPSRYTYWFKRIYRKVNQHILKSQLSLV